MMRLLHLLIIALFVTPLTAFAQAEAPKPAILIADDVRVDQNRILIAQGNVEAFQGEIRIKASEIRYDQRSGALLITGPITLQDGDEISILADQANLSSDLQNGLLTGARLVLNQQLQLAAVELNRVDGRYTQLYKTAVTSCHICSDGRQPLWQIRAKRVIHDQQEQQLYFDGAQFRIRSIPVFYLPRLRLPDPTLERATGFLIPSLRSTSLLSTGIKVPYFIKLGDHRDLTLTPYLSSRTRTLEFRYRQAFARGSIEFEGAVTRDDLRSGETRGYLFGSGQFDLNRGYVLEFDIEATSDDAYLREYGFSDKDRLDSEISVSRARRDKYVRAGFVNFKTLRDGEDNATLPTNVFDFDYERRLFPTAIGGELSLDANAHAHFRTSSLDTDSADADSIVDGRDVLRLSVEVDWKRQWTFSNGVQTQTNLGFAADALQINQDSTFPDTDSAIDGYASITLRYPLIRKTLKATQTVEPILQVGYTGGDDLNVPVEESTRVEFDEGNLLSLSRFPRPDRRERGGAVAYGVNWGRYASSGWNTTFTVGQVLRDIEDTDFTQTSGLSSTASDFLVAGQFQTETGLQIIGRGLFDEDFNVSKAELRGIWSTKKTSISTSFVWLTDDLAEDRPDEISELTFDGSYQINPRWSANANLRYDLIDDRAASAGVGFTYENECVSVDLTIDRRNTTSTTVEPSTDLGLSVSLRGFSASNGTQHIGRSCGKQAK
jgi:LPS-assembly protein